MRALPRTIRTAVVGSVASLAVIASAPAALAAPGDWTQLSTFSAATSKPEMTNTAELTMARFADAAQIVWEGDTATGSSYFTAIVNGAGAIAAPSREVISNWQGLIKNPRLISLSGQRFLVFSGLNPGYTGAAYYATSADGLTWGVGPGSLSAANSVYAGYGNDAVDNAGTPVWVGQSSSMGGILWHAGISPSAPAPAGTDGHFALPCCGYDAATARDEATGVVWAAFYSNASGTTEKGVQVGQILPTPGAFAAAPGSITTNDYGVNSLDPGQRLAMTSRAGGGVYVAFTLGYPSPTGIRILELGTNRAMDIAASGRIGRISLTSDPAGRLWLVYADSNRIKAVHTNPAATQLGSIGSWGAPAGTETIWKSAALGSAGGVDIAASSDAGGKINAWYTQALRTLTVSASPGTVRRGHNVTIRVTDAGAPVAGVRVRFGSRSATTNAAGKATFRPTSRGTVRVTAKKAGFNDGSTGVRVR